MILVCSCLLEAMIQAHQLNVVKPNFRRLKLLHAGHELGVAPCSGFFLVVICT